MSASKSRKATRRVTFRDSLGGRWRLVHCTPEQDARLISAEGEALYGLCDPETRTVLVNVAMPPESLAATRFHELVHVSLHGNSHLDDQHEEQIIAIMERHLLPVLAQFGLDLGWRP